MPEQTTDDAVVIERLVEAPIAQVWAMWTDPKRFAAWYGPTGATVGPSGSTCGPAASGPSP